MTTLNLKAQILSLFLDLDGTLTPIKLAPGDVGPDRARNALVRRTANVLNGRLAIVSGRALADVDRILDGTVTCVSGSHGMQRRTANMDVFTFTPHQRLDEALKASEALAVKYPALVIEAKPLGVALHYRKDPELHSTVWNFAQRLADSLGLALQEGDKVFELLTPGADKGDAVKAYMAEAPFVGSLPVFIGDDLTDERGFGAALELGGFGILVGPKRETAALYRLNDVSDVMLWLESLQASESVRLGGNLWAD